MPQRPHAPPPPAPSNFPPFKLPRVLRSYAASEAQRKGGSTKAASAGQPSPSPAKPSTGKTLAGKAASGAATPGPKLEIPASAAAKSANATTAKSAPASFAAWLRRQSPRVRMAILVPGFAIACTALFVAAMLVYYTAVFPNPLALRNKERAPVIRILARDGAVLAERGAAHDYMPLDLLPRHVIDAVVATEDRRFWDHFGLDPYGLARAVFANVRAGRFAQGGSTLTQQLAKNLFLSSERTIGRKVEELLLALWLEVRLSKRDILELYLNQVYFGGGAYGIESAAHRYFEKSARELNLAEGAIIAGLLKAPSKYSPASSPGAARARGRTVLKKMLDAKLISAEDERRATRARIQFAEAKSNKDQSGIEYAIDFVLERMPALVAADRADIVVETTIDPALQRKAQSIVQTQLTAQGQTTGAGQAAVVVLDAEGGIRALVGGRSYGESQFNRAVKARRQPGSVFKPLVYLTAIENGYTPDTVAYDLPLNVEGWNPRNDNGQYIGAVSLRQALAQSINTVAVRLLLDVGASKVAATARRLGIKSELREGPTMALGSSELTLLEMTGAFGMLGNGGQAIEPHAIRRVRLSTGRVLYARTAPRTVQAVAPQHVAAMNDMLHTAMVSGTGKRAALANHPAAGKTGTTTDFRDAWFVGYTAQLAGGVWVGNDNGQTMNKVMGGTLPAQIWRDVMQAAHEGRPTVALAGTSRAGQTNAQGPTSRELLPWAKPRTASSPQPQPSLPAAKRGGPQPSVAQSAEQKLAPSDTAAPVAPPAAPNNGRRVDAKPAAPRTKVTAHKPQVGTATAAAKSGNKAAHPNQPIGEDFIAKALETTSEGGEPPKAVASNPPPSTGRFDADDIRRRIDQQGEALPGMMSLGSGGAGR